MYLSFPRALPSRVSGEEINPGRVRQSRASLEFVGISVLAKPSGSYPPGTSERVLGFLYQGSFSPLKKITLKTLF